MTQGAVGEFDGIVCFGGVDWWYHNRGHYDLQLMRELSEHLPVLYVNSIAMRVPRLTEGGMFFRRVRRKLASLRRGLVRVRPRFGVFSPLAVPGSLGTLLSRAFTPAQVRGAARALGVQRPLVWVACPPAARFLDALRPAALVYQRTDRFEAFHGVDAAFIGRCHRELAARADVTLFCNHELFAAESADCRAALFLDHGVDYERFAQAGAGAAAVPQDVAGIPRPRVGFVGGLDAHTFDPALFLEVAGALPEASFVLVGACSLPEGWCTLPNVHLLGRRPYEEVAAYMAACDVLIMPWAQNEWVRACNPVKLKEYLAVGRPIVSTDFPELAWYPGLVRIARDPAAFQGELRAALRAPADAEPGRRRVEAETWTQKSRELLAFLAARGLRPAP